MLPPAVLELLLQAAFRRDLPGFEQVLSDIMRQMEIPAWGLLFPPSVPAGGRHLLIAHAVRADGPLLKQLSRSEVEMLYPATPAARQTWEGLARELAPAAYPQGQVLYLPRPGGQLGLAFFVFCAAGDRDSQTPEKSRQLGALGQHLLHCFGQMAERAEHQFTTGLLRTVGHLHSEGLCLLQADGKVLFANRTFREQIHLCQHGPDALQSINLPAQFSLPEVWRRACRRCSDENRASSPPADGGQDPAAGNRFFVKVNVPLGTDQEVVGTVQLPVLQTGIGPRSFFLLKSRVEKAATRRTRDADQLWQELGLSRRETDVARLVVQGLSADELAARLSISVTTVKTHLQSIFFKAGVRSRLQLTALLHGQAPSSAATAKKSRRAIPPERRP